MIYVLFYEYKTWLNRFDKTKKNPLSVVARLIFIINVLWKNYLVTDKLIYINNIQKMYKSFHHMYNLSYIIYVIIHAACNMLSIISLNINSIDFICETSNSPSSSLGKNWFFHILPIYSILWGKSKTTWPIERGQSDKYYIKWVINYCRESCYYCSNLVIL